MKIHFLVSTIFLAALAFFACKSPENKATNPAQTQEKATDHDPYFTETTEIESKNGPRCITRNILEDRNGHFWFSAWSGIIRYDGTTFTNFTNKEKLRRYHVFSLLEDSKGNLWFGTIGAGVYRFDGKNFTNFTVKEGLVNNKLGGIMEDKNGNIWFGTFGGLSRFDGKTFTNFTTENGLCDNDVNDMVQDKTGKIWIVTRNGVSFFDGTTFNTFLKDDGLPFTNVRTVMIDRNESLWFGGADGLLRFDGQNFEKLSKKFVGYLLEDKKGSIWMSANAENAEKLYLMSLYRFDGVKPPILNNEAEFTEILKGKGQVFGILEDSKGGIWFGLDTGVGCFDGTNLTFF